MNDTPSETPAINGTDPMHALARQLYEANRARTGEGRPWEHAHAGTRDRWVVRAGKVAADRIEAELQAPPDTRPKRRYATTMLKLDVRNGNMLECEMPDGARVIHSFITFEAQSVLVAQGQPQSTIMPVLVLRFDPDKPKRRYRFLVVPVGQGIETRDELVDVACVVNPNNSQPFVVYEVIAGALQTGSPSVGAPVDIDGTKEP